MVLGVAVFNAGAGICLCHHDRESGAPAPCCCHHPGPVLTGVDACCHAESADHILTKLDPPQVLPSVLPAVSAHADVPLVATTVSRTPACSASPPVTVLRA